MVGYALVDNCAVCRPSYLSPFIDTSHDRSPLVECRSHITQRIARTLGVLRQQHVLARRSVGRIQGEARREHLGALGWVRRVDQMWTLYQLLVSQLFDSISSR